MTEDILSQTKKPSRDALLRSHVLKSNCFDETRYEYDFKFRSNNPDQPMGVHTTLEMLECLEKNPKIELEARVLGFTENGLKQKKFNRAQFKEAFKKNNALFKENDAFARDLSTGGSFVGNDFTPLVGGPFYKNLYYYEDYIRMHAECFYAYHNDPIAKAIVSITNDFVLGTGFEVQCDTSTEKGKLAMAVWRAFEKANNLQAQIDDVCSEISIYGETLLYWLPHNQTKIVYQLNPGDTIPVGMIPRIRVLDPSNMIEIVTYPEDITRKLFYVWLTPTQYQIYTGGTGEQNLGASVQPSLKFIYQQIPAEQIMHYKVNAVSNEKRGRSDLFPVLGYLKRLRDSVNYSLIGLQKSSAWSIDTMIDGSQSDIDAYVDSQKALGTIPEAGSEFVHSKYIKREYLGNSHASAHTSDAFQWCISMICAGVQIPMSYFGTHLSGGETRASALVSTEPVAKKFEKRRRVMGRVLEDMWDHVMGCAGIKDVNCEIIFPELITQDRSQKLKDILLSEQAGWISSERAATLSAKELGIQDYHYQKEQENRKDTTSGVPYPLTQPQLRQDPGVTGLTGDEKRGIKNELSRL